MLAAVEGSGGPEVTLLPLRQRRQLSAAQAHQLHHQQHKAKEVS